MPVVQCRFASKKAQGSSRNGRDGNPKFRGVKKNHLQRVEPGHIIIRQLGNRFHPGENVGCGRDFTIFATAPGTVRYESNRTGRSFIHVVADPGHGAIRRFYPQVGHTKQQTILKECLGVDVDAAKQHEN